MKKKVVFFGSSIHSVSVLKRLLNLSYLEVVALVTTPDRPVGRKGIVTPTPVSVYGQENKIPVLKPGVFTKEEVEKITRLKPDLFIVCYYGLKIPKEIINLTPLAGINLHPSLLPSYRGAAPGEWAIANGDKETGITILTVEEEFDSGKIIAQEKETIRETDTSEDLYLRLFAKGADLLMKILPAYLKGELKLYPQDEKKASFAPRLTREKGRINWKKTDAEVERMIRAFSPWPGTWTMVGGKRLKILKAHLEKGKLAIDLVQLEGKKPVSFSQFRKAYPNLSLFTD